MSRRRDRIHIAITTALIALVVLAVAPRLNAQDSFAVEASQIHQPGAGESNIAETLLTALANMDDPPESIPDTPTALLMLPGDPGWSQALEWATAPNQRAMLKTLRDITNPSKQQVFTLPYGFDNTPPSIQATGLAIDLGDPPLLANADFGYLNALDALFALVSIDAARLAQEDDPEAAYRLIQWIRLARMVADQPFSVEKGWAIHSMRLGVMRLLDLFALHPKLMTEREIIRLVRELKEKEIRIERIHPPYADRIAMHELVAATYIERRGPNPATFGPTLAALMSEGQPLNLFGEAAYFQNVAEQQANWFDATEKIDAIYSDWERRWTVPHYDVIWMQQMERRLIDPARFTLIESFSPDLYSIIQDRLNLRADLAGARMALSVIGYRQGKGVWPSDLAAIRPTFVDTIDRDPFHDGGSRTIKQFEILEYFVPIRDQKFDERVDPHPHKIRVFRAGDIFQGLSHDGGQSAMDRVLDDVIDELTNVKDRGAKEAVVMMFQRLAEELDEKGVTASNYKKKINEGVFDDDPDVLMPKPRSSRSGPNVTETLGVSEEVFEKESRAFLIENFRALFGDADFTTTYSKFRRGKRITPEESAKALGAVLRAGASAMMSIQRKLQPSSFGPDFFDIELDDKNFVIFARGIDRRADWAREVGPGAADYLIWPPVLTLLRSELRQEPPMSAWSD